MVQVEKFNQFSQELDSIDEMAASVPAGSIVKCTVTNDSAVYNGGWEGRTIQERLSSLNPKFDPSINGYYIMKVDKSASRFIEGTVLYMNGLKTSYVGDKFRFKYQDAIKPGKEFRILEANKKEITETVGKKIVYVDGTEPELLGHDGKSPAGLIEGEYICKSVNFKLTAEEDETVYVFYLKDGENKNEGFSIKSSSIPKLLTQLSEEQKKTIADWIGKQLGIDIFYGKESSWHSYDSFVIKRWRLSNNGNRPWVTNASYGPFISKSQAEKYEKLLKEEDISLCPKQYSINADTSKMELDDLIKFCNNNGVSVKMKDMLKISRGSSAGKAFDL